MRIHFPFSVREARRPHVTAVVPCFNYGRYLGECVTSILSQSEVVTSVIIVDDCSTDDSAAVADRLAAEHRAIRVIRHDRNLGPVATFNRGLSHVDSDYLLLISADDLVAPGAFERATALMEANQRIGMVYGRAVPFRGDAPRFRGRRTTWTSWPGRQWLRLQFERGWNPIHSPEAVVRTTTQHAVGGYDPGLPHTHDLEMWLRIAQASDIGHVNGADQAFYRLHGDNLSGRFHSGIARDLEPRLDAYLSFLERAGTAADAPSLREILVRRMVDEVLGLGVASLKERGATSEDIDRLQELALRVDARADTSAAWSDLVRLRSSGTQGMGARARALRREIADRARWRRWRVIGI